MRRSCGAWLYAVDGGERVAAGRAVQSWLERRVACRRRSWTSSGSRSSCRGSGLLAGGGRRGRGRDWCACWRCCAISGCSRPRACRWDSPTDRLLVSFERYLLTERALGRGHGRGVLDVTRGCLWTGCRPVRRAGRGDGGRRDGGGAGAGRARGCRSARRDSSCRGCARSLRFCFMEGLIEVDLSQAALLPSGRRGTPLPRGSAARTLAALLCSCDRRSALGRRDYAMIVLLLRLGLRARRGRRLALDDIDWRAGELVVRGKGRPGGPAAVAG